MTLAAIQLLILTQQYSINARRWCKGFTFFSRRSKRCCSPIALAAGTEKYVRHNSPDIRCEDLTAREFAQLAGIKIKGDDFDASTTAPPLLLNFNSESTTHTSLSSDSATRYPRIWDSDFWQQDNSTPCPIRQKRSVIRKGRFHICVGHDNDDDDDLYQQLPKYTVYTPSSASTAQVVEWKRKRSRAT